MNYIKLLFCLTLLFSISACSDDEDDNTMMEDSCTQSSWVGTYTGSIDCDGTIEEVVVTLTAVGTDQIIIRYETGTVVATYDPLMFDDCRILNSASESGITLNVDVMIDGDNFTLNETISSGGMTSNCSIIATRQ